MPGSAPHRPEPALPLPAGIEGGARFEGPGDCYRPLLWRNWAATGGFALWVGLLPGPATGIADDAVTRREVALARRLWPGLGGNRCMNIADLRGAEPAGLRRATVPLRSAGMLDLLDDYAREAELVVLGYGEVPEVLSRAATDALRVLHATGRPIWCLGTLRGGAPRHVLRVPAGVSPVRWA